MKNVFSSKAAPYVLGVFIFACLAMWFSRYIQTTSFDLVQHFLLVDELFKHHEVRDGTIQRIGAMAVYPPISHWMAVVAGLPFGSGLVGITVVTVAAAFLVYVLIALLVGANSLKRITLFSVAFLALTLTSSQIGWEVVSNFFYPQLVADVFYFGVLLWVSKNQEEWKQSACFLLVGLLTMWIQPLIALHIFAAGCALMAYQLLKRWSTKTLPMKGTALCLVVVTVGAVVIILTNPAFKVMRQIAGNNGSLTFSYDSVLLVAVACAALGALNLRRHWSGKAEYVDAVLGSAVIAALGLVILQYASLKLSGDGSLYAVKKHMFIVLTLGAMNAVRMIASCMPSTDKTLRAGFVAPIFAGIASLFVLKGLIVPVAPILSALSYANQAVKDHFPGFVPGNTVSNEGTLPMMANVMVSLTSFQHQFNTRSIGWQEGASIKEGAKYVMMLNTPRVSKLCNLPTPTVESYVILNPECINKYIPGETLTFGPNALGWQYVVKGWSGAEPWGTWSLGNIGGAITLPVPPGNYRLTIGGRAYVAKQHPTQDIVVEVNGTDIATWHFDQTKPVATNSVDIPEALTKEGSLRIILKAPGAVSPAQLGQSADARILGIGAHKLTLSTIP
jgi:hypothetical protein